jgi:O-antigen ligase
MKTVLVKHIKWLWGNAEGIVIFTFFATFAFNIRKIFLTPLSFLSGVFNEYLTPSFSWADLLILPLIFIYTIKYLLGQCRSSQKDSLSQYNKTYYKSRYGLYSIAALKLRHFFCFSMSRETIFVFLFLSWMLISIIWSPLKEIAVFRAFSITEAFVLAFLALKFTRKNQLGGRVIEIALIICGAIQAIVAVSQFALNRSLGIRVLGESILGPDLPGVAKFVIEGVKHIRPYGTFPHPNILAGFLLVPIVILIRLIGERIEKTRRGSIVSHETKFFYFPLVVMTLALALLLISLILTLSRSAILALFVFIIVLIWQKIKTFRLGRRVACIATLIFLLSFGLFLISKSQFKFLFSEQSLQERNYYSFVARETIIAHPIGGTGIGQFIYQEYFLHPDLLGWQYQPVHNIYLLVTSELGIVGLALLLLLLLTILNNYCIKCNKSVLRPEILTKRYYCFIIFSFLFISLFDHYFWDIKNGIIIFSLPFILLLSKTGKENAFST